MVLIRYLAQYHDELEADMQQYYGLDLNDLGRTLTVHHASVLAAQLPAQARCCIAQEPDLAWTTETMFLRRIDYSLASLLWAMGGRKGQKPKPAETPKELQRIRESVERTDFDYIAQRLGVTNGG